MATHIIGKHAAVIGAGMAGLAAAGALARHFQRVTVLERDNLPGTASDRPGTPQSRHLHGLQVGGLRALEHLFPDIHERFAAVGCTPMRVGLDLRHEDAEFGALPQRDLQMRAYSASRSALELAVRQSVERLPNVVFMQQCRVKGILAGADGKTAIGVHVDDPTQTVDELLADLVVDASGRGALTLDFLTATGRPLPDESVVNSDIGYATALYEVPADAPSDWQGVMTRPRLPHSTRGVVLLPIEGRRWIVTVTGYGDEKPAGDEAGFLDFLEGLHTRTVYDMVSGARRASEIKRYVFPTSVRRHFERYDDFPRGLLPLGDALCSFSPTYGQGMSVAAQQAVLLDRLLARSVHTGHSLDALATSFFTEVQGVLDTPWAAVTMDFAIPGVTGHRPPDVERISKFSVALTRLAIRKPEVHKLMVEVQQLCRPRSELKRPAMVARLLMELVRIRLAGKAMNS